MTKYQVKIDRSSILKNENAGRNMYFVPGHKTYNEDGSWSRDVSIVRTWTPEPEYTCRYEDLNVECDLCKKQFSFKMLKSDYQDDCFVDNICPLCSEPECCEIEFEKFSLDMVKK